MTIRSKKLSKYPGLVQGIVYDKEKCLQYEYQDDSPAAVTEREKYLESFGINPQNVVLQNQQHTSNITIVTNQDRGRGIFNKETAIENNDGLITAEPEVYLGVFTADCVPISFYDPQRQLVGIAHSGWQGTVKNIAGQIVNTMVKQFNSKPVDIIVYLGPSIGPCCYEVSKADDDRVVKFLAEFGDRVVKKKGQKIYLDLQQAVKQQLSRAGLGSKRIEVSGICSGCNQEYNLPSYYQDRDKRSVGSMLSIIGRRENKE